MFAEGQTWIIGDRQQPDHLISIFCGSPVGDAEEMWWSLLGYEESWGSSTHAAVSPGNPISEPCSSTALLAHCYVSGAHISLGQICGVTPQRNIWSPHYVCFQQSIKASAPSWCFHHFIPVLLKHLKLGGSSLLVAQFTFLLC